MNTMLGTNTSYFKWCPNDKRPDLDSHPRAVTRAERKSINAELYDFLEDMTSGKANSCVKKYENDGLRAWTALYLQYQDRADDQQNIIDLYMKDHFYFRKYLIRNHMLINLFLSWNHIIRSGFVSCRILTCVNYL